MLFDWFTLIAQLINFLVLVWLLKRYLFKPILNAIDEREKLITGQLQEAEQHKAAAQKELVAYQQKNSAIDHHRHELLNNAINEVNAERQKLLELTRYEVDSLRLRLQELLSNEQQNLGAEIIRRTRAEVFSIVRKTLADMGSANLEEQMTAVFIKRITELKSDEKELFSSVLNNPSGEILVRSVFDLPFAQKNAILNTIKKNFNTLPEMVFESDPNLVSGIELVADGFKVSWTIEEYLISLENIVAELLKEQAGSVTEQVS